jgi:import inner membrane translocase subunit TIM54
VKQKWIDLVTPLSQQPLEPFALPRKVTVYLCAPPGDGISPAREHFRDYVKPILNAAAVDYDVVEGRQMGELRHKVAEGIRKRRAGLEGEESTAVEFWIGQGRLKRREERGVVVLGRNTWKEYLRGLQEGWLGSVEVPTPPPPPPPAAAAAAPVQLDPVETLGDAMKETEKEGQEKKPEEEKPGVPKEFITPSQYKDAQIPLEMPTALEPTGVVYLPHILGFFNTPTRLFRYVTRRYMADEVCREAAAVALGLHRPFTTQSVQPMENLVNDVGESAPEGSGSRGIGELDALRVEEKDWPKRVWKEERYKGEWTEGITVDDRVKGRLRKFYIPSDIEPKERKSSEEKN